MREGIFDQLLRIPIKRTRPGAPQFLLPQLPCFAIKERPLFTLLALLNLGPQLISSIDEPPTRRSYCSLSGDFVMTKKESFLESPLGPIGIVEGRRQVTVAGGQNRCKLWIRTIGLIGDGSEPSKKCVEVFPPLFLFRRRAGIPAEFCILREQNGV